MKLFADNNRIESMHDLEGTQFMDHFQKLYLRNNQLKRVSQSKNVGKGKYYLSFYYGVRTLLSQGI